MISLTDAAGKALESPAYVFARFFGTDGRVTLWLSADMQTLQLLAQVNQIRGRDGAGLTLSATAEPGTAPDWGGNGMSFTPAPAQTPVPAADTDVYAYDPFLTREQIEAGGVKAVDSLAELYSTCQYVSLHCPATKETIGSINYDLLKDMPKNACLINTARKEVVDETGLMQLMEERPDFRYIADVKPGAADEFVAKFGTRVFFTSKKSGAQTAEANSNAGIAAAKQACGYLKEGIDRFRVN
jgi:hypothetical protein